MQMCCCVFFFFKDTATPEIYTLPLHDALPICGNRLPHVLARAEVARLLAQPAGDDPAALRDRALLELMYACGDRKSTRLNSSHANISYAVFCLKKKKKKDAICDNIRIKVKIRI